MAAEDIETDEELRELVAQTLETKGVLGKIRAELRAQVFLALEEQEKSQGHKTHSSTKLKDFLSSREGKLAAAVVREFLEFFELHFTASVFEPEAEAYELSARAEILEQLKLQEESDVSANEPVVCGLVRKAAEPQAATISSSKLASLLATASHHGTGISDPPASRSEPQVFLGDLPITSSTFGHAQPTKAKEMASNLRSHSLAEGDTSALGLDPKFLKASTPPPLQSSLSGDHLRDFPGQGESVLGNDSQEDSSRELERLLEVANHPVAGYQSKYLTGKDAGNFDNILGQKPTSTQDSMHSSRQVPSSSHLTDRPTGGMASNSTASGQREALYEEDFQTESVHTESDVAEEGSHHSSKKPSCRSTVDGHTVDETLSRSDFSLGDTDFLETIAKS